MTQERQQLLQPERVGAQKNWLDSYQDYSVQVLRVAQDEFDKCLSGIDLSTPKSIALVGGLGNLTERFLVDSYARMAERFPQVIFTIVDVAEKGLPKVAQQLEKLQALGLPLSETQAYLQIDALREAVQNTIVVDNQSVFRMPMDAVYLATPTRYHLEDMILLLNKNIPVAVEKPIVTPEQRNIFVHACQPNAERIFSVDFMADSWPVAIGLSNSKIQEFVERLGPLRAVQGRLVEDVPLPQSRAWVFTKSVNGGGAGLDVLPHVICGLEPFLNQQGLSLQDLQLKIAEAGRYSLQGKPAPGDAESYLYLHGRIGEGGNSVRVDIDGGRIGGENYFGFSLLGERGELEFFTGSESIDAHIRFHEYQSGERQLCLIEGQGIGYDLTWFNFLAQLYGSEEHIGVAPNERVRMSLLALDLVSKAYESVGSYNEHPFAAPPTVSQVCFNTPIWEQ